MKINPLQNRNSSTSQEATNNIEVMDPWFEDKQYWKYLYN